LFELLIELFLEFLGFLGLKKRKKGKKDSISLKAKDSAPNQETSKGVAQESSLVCSGCHRILEKDAIYELGKAWCMECYKTHVLKIKS
jgi:protein-arginine kinase activator protein McsA